jgi:hypothetical protein
MDKERIAIRLEVLKLACSKSNSPEVIIATAKVLEEYLVSDQTKTQIKKKSGNAETQKASD